VHPLANRPILQMNGIGNKIIVLDLRNSDAKVSAADARAIGAANGLGFDQLMVIHDARRPGTDGYMQIFNIDGSLSAACGNGTRCVAWAMVRNSNTRHLVLESDAGLLDCHREGEWRFWVDMGEPRFAWQSIPLAHDVGDTCRVQLPDPPPPAATLPQFCAVNMGNPHAVFFVDDPEGFDLATTGKAVEHHPLFPERVNTSLVRVEARDAMRAHVWERGAGATLACGSAACAILVAGVKRDICDRRATITLPGGELVIEWRIRDNHVIMTGDVELEQESHLDAAIFETLPA
jgi:diaminopimelate epimerase